MRAINATRMAIDRTHAHVGRLEWDLERAAQNPTADVRLDESMRDYEAQALAGLKRTLELETQALAALRAAHAAEKAAAEPPVDPLARQARYRERNREAIAGKARERRAKARQLADLLS